MIIIHILYIPLYSFFKIVANRPAYDSPENLALGFLTFLISLSTTLIYSFSAVTYSKKVAGGLFLASAIIVFVALGFYYLRKDFYLTIYKKHKNTLFIGGIIDLIWTGFVMYYGYIILWQN